MWNAVDMGTPALSGALTPLVGSDGRLDGLDMLAAAGPRRLPALGALNGPAHADVGCRARRL